MATIKEELSAIAEEQGYEGDAPKTIAQAVNALGTVIGGGGGGGGTELFAVTFSGSGNNITADKTFQEIIDALLAGKVVVGRKSELWDTTVGDCMQYNLSGFNGVDGEGFSGTFTRVMPNTWNNTVMVYYYKYSGDGTITEGHMNLSAATS